MSEAPSRLENTSAYPPSIQAGIPKLGPNPPRGWKRVLLGKLLRTVERPAILSDSETYQLVTAKRNRGGIVAREVLRGEQIRTKTQFFVETGDFLVSNRQISHGACGIVPACLSGSIVSNEYTAFHTSDSLDPRFLEALSHSIYFQQTCFHSSIGVHVEKLVFRLEDWIGWEFDIPPLPEQRRIAGMFKIWDEAISRTERLIAAKRRRLNALLARLIFTRAHAKRRTDLQIIRLKDLGKLIRGVSYDPATDVVKAGRADIVAVLTAANVQSGKVSLIGGETNVIGQRVKTEQLVGEGDFVLSMSNGSKNLVGKAGFLYEDLDRPAAPGAFCAVFRPRNHRAGLIASILFQSEGYREQLHIALAGSSINNLTNAELEEFTFHVSSILSNADAAFFGTIGDDLRKGEDALAKLRTQKRGLMQKLLNGEWQLDERFDPPALTSPSACAGGAV